MACLCQMYAYRLSQTSSKLIASYLKDRYNRVKIGAVRSDWKLLRKGTPQGSVMGPFAYNAHTNDLVLVLAAICDIFNYVDFVSIDSIWTHIRIHACSGTIRPFRVNESLNPDINLIVTSVCFNCRSKYSLA